MCSIRGRPDRRVGGGQYGAGVDWLTSIALPVGGIIGHRVPAADALARTLTSPENAAELAREAGEQLPADLDPAEQARVVSKVKT